MNLRRNGVATIVTVLVGLPPCLLAGTIENLDLELGREHTVLPGPAYLAGAAAPVEIGEIQVQVDTSRPIVDKLGATGSRDSIAKKIDLGALLAEEMRLQAGAMGVPLGNGGWTVTGTIDDILIENREIPWGPVLYYGHVELTLTVRAPDGETATVEYGSHPTTGRYNAGFGQKDENIEALAQVLIASAQEAVALLNRDFFHLPPHPEVLSLVTRVATSPADEAEEFLRLIGLSGAQQAVNPLLGILHRSQHESVRAEAVRALGLLGEDEIVPQLVQRYSSADEDVRYAILVALDQLGESGHSVVSMRGVRDENKACRSLAQRLARE